jgi:hypothetical protein
MRRGQRSIAGLPDGIRRPEAVPLDQPSGVVGVAEFEQCEAEFLDGVEGPHPQEVLLEGADEALGATLLHGSAQ